MRTHVSSVGLLVRSDPALSFIYPEHIPRACLDALPAQPGIYIFRDEAGVAIYVGKSVNIRHRVLSHLRTPEEMQMLQATRHIDFERCGGEIGALLRESQLIKQLQPVYNQKLRRLREMCSLRLTEAGLDVVFARDCDFARTEGLYGFYASRKGALEALDGLAQAAGLCSALIALEKVVPGRPCFARQLGRCGGACVGVESVQAHNARIAVALAALRVAPWPFPGAVGIVEESEGYRQVHLVDHWCYLGPRPDGRSGKGKTREAATAFDIDVYNILARPLLQGELLVEAIPV
ncbi:endonuclease [Oxalobacteraceae bacterium]|nr:endonuclease [Oxalobacteraceae bacterium]